MKYTFTILLTACLMSGSYAQTATPTGLGFETAVLDSGKVINGSNGDTLFSETDGPTTFHFPLNYNTQFNYWAGGWAISRKYDSATMASDFSKHLYCNKGFKGQDNSATFAIGTEGSYFTTKSPGALSSVYINNCTYTYNSMLLGDQFAKKFGGVSGNDSDFLLLKAMHFFNGLLVDSSQIYLGDYRSSKDSLLSNWTLLYLRGDSVVFHLTGSDTGQFGLNTPAYFAIDQAIVWVAGLKQFNGISARIYPNPAKDRVFVQAEYPVVSLCLRDLQGREVASSSEAEMSLLGITKGIYYLTIKTSGGNATAKLIVE